MLCEFLLPHPLWVPWYKAPHYIILSSLNFCLYFESSSPSHIPKSKFYTPVGSFLSPEQQHHHQYTYCTPVHSRPLIDFSLSSAHYSLVVPPSWYPQDASHHQPAPPLPLHRLAWMALYLLPNIAIASSHINVTSSEHPSDCSLRKVSSWSPSFIYLFVYFCISLLPSPEGNIPFSPHFLPSCS